MRAENLSDRKHKVHLTRKFIEEALEVEAAFINASIGKDTVRVEAEEDYPHTRYDLLTLEPDNFKICSFYFDWTFTRKDKDQDLEEACLRMIQVGIRKSLLSLIKERME